MAMSGGQFKFIVEAPKRTALGSTQYAKIVARFPQVMFPCALDKYESMSREEHIRLAIAELKVELMKEISAAEFVYEER